MNNTDVNTPSGESNQAAIRLECITTPDANHRVARAFNLILQATVRSKEGMTGSNVNAQELKTIEVPKEELSGHEGTDQGLEASRPNPKSLGL